jgi:hypothetical protein
LTDPNPQKIDIQEFLLQVEALHKYLLEMRLEEILGREVLEVMTDPQAQLTKKYRNRRRKFETLCDYFPLSASNTYSRSDFILLPVLIDSHGDSIIHTFMAMILTYISKEIAVGIYCSSCCFIIRGSEAGYLMGSVVIPMSRPLIPRKGRRISFFCLLLVCIYR